MAIKNFFLLFRGNEHEEEIRKKISSMEMSIEDLKNKLKTFQEEKQSNEDAKSPNPPIIIERVNIEKIILDKYELNNNFGQLGIKELKGKLNIGASYGSEFTPMHNQNPQDNKEESKSKNTDLTNCSQGPKINIKANNKD
ncbi:hypothetical protein [Bacillus rubiinfantis]|uniref:hypothetical protein n=1 Tax=Bacillus rubiinfantis TaxID=1499680 RepID=UPI000693E96C|nr:hypothetical protein [Bacillus rubiinfantis]